MGSEDIFVAALTLMGQQFTATLPGTAVLNQINSSLELFSTRIMQQRQLVKNFLTYYSF